MCRPVPRALRRPLPRAPCPELCALCSRQPVWDSASLHLCHYTLSYALKDPLCLKALYAFYAFYAFYALYATYAFYALC